MQRIERGAIVLEFGSASEPAATGVLNLEAFVRPGSNGQPLSWACRTQLNVLFIFQLLLLFFQRQS